MDFSKTTVLVTGASGFVGGHIVEALARHGIRPRCLVRKTSRLDFIRARSPELVDGDVTSRESLERAVEGVAGIIHCAGVTQALSLSDFMRINRDGCQNLYEACLARNPAVRRIVHVSSLAAWGPSIPDHPVQEDNPCHPVSHYGMSKLAGHRVAESYRDRLPVVILAPPAVYGPFDRAFLKYFAMVKRGVSLAVGKGDRWISLIYAGDLARAAIACLENEQAAGREFLVDDGGPHTWQSVSAAIARTMHTTPRVVRVPARVAKLACVITGGAAACIGRTTLFNRDKLKEFLQPAWTCSSSKIRAELGFAPGYTLEQGLEETYRWYREHHWL